MTIIMNKSLGTLLLVLHVSTIHKDEGAAGHVEEMADHERGPMGCVHKKEGARSCWICWIVEEMTDIV